jgi:glycosyltransferase involved in cell wall biosynthesis
MGPGLRRDDAQAQITFPQNISDQQIVAYFQHAEALLFPGEEDFGITAVEALAAGTPVVAYKAGGALDYIKPGVNGEFFTEFTSEALGQAINKLGLMDGGKIKQSADRFEEEIFKNKIKNIVLSI